MRGDIKFFLLSGFFLILAISLPYIYGISRQSSGKVYTGLPECNYQDINLYLTAIKQGEKKLVWENPYSVETQKAMPIYLFYLLLGRTMAFLNLKPIVVYHITRIVLAVAGMLVLYKFIAFFTDDKLRRRIAFLLTLFSSGFGFFFSMLGVRKRLLIDLWMPELNFFFSAYNSPHFVLSEILIIASFLTFLIACEKESVLWAALTGLAVFSEGIFHPYGIFIIYSVMFVYSLFAGKYSRRFFLIVLVMSLPSVGYYFHIIASDPVWLEWARANWLRSPSWLSYLSGFGIILPFAIYSLREYFKFEDKRKLFIAIWFLVILLIILLPIKSNRKFVLTLNIPICILASGSILSILKRKTVAIVALVIFAAGTNVFIVTSDMAKIKNAEFPYYISDCLMKSFEWLHAQRGGGIVLSNIETGNFVPVFTRNKVFIGHWDQTINPMEKRKIARDFFDAKTSWEKREKILSEFRIKYIIGDKFVFNNSPGWLEKVFECGQTVIYGNNQIPAG
ncbi:hypothetical protein KJ633_01455 [bacterium]|nr:hypothetical protein [bacterium]MBU3955105.1 hypothetical protein [bacterium]